MHLQCSRASRRWGGASRQRRSAHDVAGGPHEGAVLGADALAGAQVSNQEVGALGVPEQQVGRLHVQVCAPGASVHVRHALAQLLQEPERSAQGQLAAPACVSTGNMSGYFYTGLETWGMQGCTGAA